MCVCVCVLHFKTFYSISILPYETVFFKDKFLNEAATQCIKNLKTLKSHLFVHVKSLSGFLYQTFQFLRVSS